jgi:hypothetical protein
MHPQKTHMPHTKGSWLRHNIENDEVEFWYDGKLEYAFEGSIKENNRIDISLAIAFINDAIAIGKRIRSREIKDLLNG